MFYGLMQALQGPASLDGAAFYVAGRRFYEGFSAAEPGINAHQVVKEWEIVQRGLARRPDLGRLREYEAELGDPTLWGPIIGDRRISLGRLCTLRQDYTPRFSHEEMLGIIEEGLVTLERLFDELRPDAVFSFVCVTFAEYLAYLLARARGIRYLSLRSTRVENFVTFAPTVFEPSEPLIAEDPAPISARHGGRVELGRAALPRRRARRRAALRRRRAGLAPGDAGPPGQRAAAREAGWVRAGRIRLLVPRRPGRQPGAGFPPSPSCTRVS